MTAGQFAQNVANRLKARRLQLDWTLTDVQMHGGPTYHTVQKVEAGHLATPEVMERHITALGLTLREVFLAALTPHGREESALSPEALEVARVFDQAAASGKQALRSMAQALDRTGPRFRFGPGHRIAPAAADGAPAEMPDSATGSD